VSERNSEEEERSTVDASSFDAFADPAPLLCVFSELLSRMLPSQLS